MFWIYNFLLSIILYYHFLNLLDEEAIWYRNETKIRENCCWWFKVNIQYLRLNWWRAALVHRIRKQDQVGLEAVRQNHRSRQEVQPPIHLQAVHGRHQGASPPELDEAGVLRDRPHCYWVVQEILVSIILKLGWILEVEEEDHGWSYH